MSNLDRKRAELRAAELAVEIAEKLEQLQEVIDREGLLDEEISVRGTTLKVSGYSVSIDRHWDSSGC